MQTNDFDTGFATEFDPRQVVSVGTPGDRSDVVTGEHVDFRAIASVPDMNLPADTGQGRSGKTLAWSPGGDLLAFATGFVVHLYDATTGAAGTNFRMLESCWQVRSVAWAPDGRTLAAVGTDGTLFVWDTHRSTLTWTSVVLPDGRMATFTAGGRLVTGEPESFDDQLFYLVEPTKGQFEVLAPSEFWARLPPEFRAK